MSGIWRNDESTSEGKYMVTRRDGTVVEWPSFVIGAKDPAAGAALRAYANAAEAMNYDPQYVLDVRQMAGKFDSYLASHGKGDPDAPRHRVDDPETIQRMRGS